MVGYPSGQRGQTVNLLAYAYAGSNPAPTTTSKTRPKDFHVDFGGLCGFTGFFGGFKWIISVPDVDFGADDLDSWRTFAASSAEFLAELRKASARRWISVVRSGKK